MQRPAASTLLSVFGSSERYGNSQTLPQHLQSAQTPTESSNARHSIPGCKVNAPSIRRVWRKSGMAGSLSGKRPKRSAAPEA